MLQLGGSFFMYCTSRPRYIVMLFFFSFSFSFFFVSFVCGLHLFFFFPFFQFLNCVFFISFVPVFEYYLQ